MLLYLGWSGINNNIKSSWTMKKVITFLKRIFFGFLPSGFFFFVQAASSLQPATLTCEYMQNPLGIDTKRPELSWTFTATKRNQVQSAYEIIVSDNPEDIQLAKGNMSSTGKVITDQSMHVECGRKPL